VTLTWPPVTDRCDSCPSSREGCEARQLFARGERAAAADVHTTTPPTNAPTMQTMHCRAFFLVRIHPEQPLVIASIPPCALNLTPTRGAMR